jgi:hypothetical protein
LAVSVAVCAVAGDPAVAIKPAVVAPAGAVTDGGKLTAALLLDNTTVPPPGVVRVTVHELAAPAANVDGAHASDRTVGGPGVSAIGAVLDTPFSVAVTVADWPVKNVPAVAVKPAVVAAAATATNDGKLRAALLLVSVTVPPPGPESVTVQAAAPPATSDPGRQPKPVNAGATTGGGADDVVVPVAAVPPPPLMGMFSPAGVAPIALVSPIAMVATPRFGVAVTTATSPSGIGVALAPASTQR